MSYAAIPRADYSVLFPQSATHAGSPSWTKSPIPSWGENPLRAGPYMLGAVEMTEAERLRAEGQASAAAAANQAASSAAIHASVTHAVDLEESKFVADPSVATMRTEYTETSWPYLAIGGAGVLGVGLIVYALRSRRG